MNLLCYLSNLFSDYCEIGHDRMVGVGGVNVNVMFLQGWVASVGVDLKMYFNTNSELLQNRTEKHMPSKTTINWLFNDICYLFIACFDWKIGVSQQIVVRVNYILNIKMLKKLNMKKLKNYNTFSL